MKRVETGISTWRYVEFCAIDSPQCRPLTSTGSGTGCQKMIGGCAIPTRVGRPLETAQGADDLPRQEKRPPLWLSEGSQTHPSVDIQHPNQNRPRKQHRLSSSKRYTISKRVMNPFIIKAVRAYWALYPPKCASLDFSREFSS